MSSEKGRYPCAECASRRSPLCELCTRIESPSGRERKPKYFCREVRGSYLLTDVLAHNRLMERRAETEREGE